MKEAVYSMATAPMLGRTLRIPIKTGEMEIPTTGATTTHMTSRSAATTPVPIKLPKEPHPHRGYTKKKLTRTHIKARRKKGRR